MESVSLTLYGEDQQALAVPEEVKKLFENIKRDAHYWETLTGLETPEEAIYEREGSKGKMMSYIKQYYVIHRLNELYPGWTLVKTKLWYQPEVRTWVMTGKLKIRYYSFTDEKMVTRKISGVGALEVHSKTTDKFAPSQPDDMAKGTRTELIKNCGYILGIGFDVYSQEIPVSLKARLLDYIDKWKYTEDTIAKFASIETPKVFRQAMASLPNQEHTKIFVDIMDRISKHSITLNMSEKDLWVAFQQQIPSTIQTWLSRLDETINKIIDKQKGEQHGT